MYWYGESGNWSDYTNHWSNNSGNSPASPASNAPTSTDDAIFDANSAADNYEVTVDATANCKNFTMNKPTGVGKKVTWSGISALNIYGNLNLAGGTAEITMNYGGWITFMGTSGTKTIDINGLSLISNITFDGSGSTFQLARNFETVGQTITFRAGTFDASTYDFTLKSSNPILAITTTPTFYNLIFNGPNSTTGTLQLNGNIIISNSLTVAGNSAIKRVLVKSNTLGTARTITTTGGSVAVTNADFQDITATGDAGDWDLSAIAGGSGDCGGCTGITFTTADDWYWHADSGSISNYAKWYTATNGGGSQMASTRIPLPQDHLILDDSSIDNVSQTITFDLPRIGSVDFAPLITANVSLSKSIYIFGSLSSENVGTLSGNYSFIFSGRNNCDINQYYNGTNALYNVSVELPGATLTLKGNLYVTNNTTVTNGTLNCVDGENNWAISTGFVSVASSANATLTLGSATHLITGTIGTVWNFGANGVLSANTSTIKLTGALTGNITFAGGGKTTYNNLWNNTTNNYVLIISGSNTLAGNSPFTIDAGREVNFANSSNTTFNVSPAWLGTSGSHIVIHNGSGTTHATLTKAGGGVISGCDYIDASYLTGSPSATWYIGSNSTVSNCTDIYASTLVVKILSEVVSVVSVFSNFLTRARIYTQQLIVVPTLSKISTLSKILSQVVSVVSSKIFSFGRTFQEVVSTNSIFSKVSTIKKIIVESVVVASVGSFVLSPVKVLSETINVSDIYSRISNAVKTFTESIVIASNILFGAARSFIERINIYGIFSGGLAAIKVLVDNLVVNSIGSFVGTLAKTLVEITIVSGSLVFGIARLFLEVVLVASSILKLIGKIFLDGIAIIVLLIANAGKVLIENLIVVPVMITVLVAYKLLSEVVKITESILRSGARIFTQSLSVNDPDAALLKIVNETLSEIVQVVSGSIVFAVGIVLNQIVKVGSNTINAGARIFSQIIKISSVAIVVPANILLETINVLGSMAEKVIARTLNETIYFIDHSIKYFTRVFTEIFSVVGNMVALPVKIFLEVISAADIAVRFAVGKIFKEIIKILGNTIDITTKIFSEILLISDILSHRVARILKEIISVADITITFSIAKIFVQAIKVSSKVVDRTTRIFSELIKVGSSGIYHANKMLLEVVKVVGLMAGWSVGKIFVQGVALSPSLSKTSPKSFSEVLKVSANLLSMSSRIMIEILILSGIFIIGTISKLLKETINISISFIKISYKIFSQTVKFSASYLNTQIKYLSENISVSGNFILGTISKLLKETVKVIQSYRFAMARILSQIIKVSSILIKTLPGRLMEELIKINLVFGKFNITKIFTENVSIGWAKVKLVLNGIQVGLWKKIARVTNGVWRKISRNDN